MAWQLPDGGAGRDNWCAAPYRDDHRGPAGRITAASSALAGRGVRIADPARPDACVEKASRGAAPHGLMSRSAGQYAAWSARVRITLGTRSI
jgi:hypothetical protein